MVFYTKHTFIDKVTKKIIKVNHNDSGQALAFDRDEIEKDNYNYTLRNNHEKVINLDSLMMLNMKPTQLHKQGVIYDDNCINIPRSEVFYL